MPQLRDAIHRAYEEWGLTGINDHLTHERLAELLSEIEPKLPNDIYRLVPNTFDAHDPLLRAFPRPLNYQWTSVERILRHTGSRGVMMRTPAFWHLGLPLHDACRSLGIPIFANEPENIPVGAVALTQTGIDTIVTDNLDAPAFASYLAEKKLPAPRSWILIHQLHGDWEVAHGVLSAPAVAQEVHLFPTMVLLEQCPLLAATKQQHFHIGENVVVEMEPDATYVSSIGNDPFPLYRFRLHVKLRAHGYCPCNRTVIERV